MPMERCRENKRPFHIWPHPMSWPCHCQCPCPVQVTVAVTELIIRMVWCMSRRAQTRMTSFFSWQCMFLIYFYNCSWYCWYLCGACIRSELLLATGVPFGSIWLFWIIIGDIFWLVKHSGFEKSSRTVYAKLINSSGHLNFDQKNTMVLYTKRFKC